MMWHLKKGAAVGIVQIVVMVLLWLCDHLIGRR